MRRVTIRVTLGANLLSALGVLPFQGSLVGGASRQLLTLALIEGGQPAETVHFAASWEARRLIVWESGTSGVFNLLLATGRRLRGGKCYQEGSNLSTILFFLPRRVFPSVCIGVCAGWFHLAERQFPSVGSGSSRRLVRLVIRGRQPTLRRLCSQCMGLVCDFSVGVAGNSARGAGRVIRRIFLQL